MFVSCSKKSDFVAVIWWFPLTTFPWAHNKRTCFLFEMNVHSNVTFPGALQTLRNLLGLGDEDAAVGKREQILFYSL